MMNEYQEGFNAGIDFAQTHAKIELNKLMAKLALYREALEFYANGDETSLLYNDSEYMESVSSKIDVSLVQDKWMTGKRAREALKGAE